MKFVLVLCVVGAVVAFDSDTSTRWNSFKTSYNKRYRSEGEEFVRMRLFSENVRYIEKFNRDLASRRGYSLALNQYADMTDAEFMNKMLGVKFNASELLFHRKKSVVEVNVADLPATVDWRKEGYVTAVKDQGQCGSCWAFSTTGSIEGQHFKQTGKLVALSEQQMVDCSWLNQGCNGGQMILAFLYVEDNGGLVSETTYPYKAQAGKCTFDKNSVAASIKTYERVSFMSESSLQEAVATVGPVSVAIDASGKDFRFYKDGIYNPASCGRFILDHGVLAIGYGSDGAGQDYWLVKNSWNTTWGMEGYFKLARNQDNKCGIATMAAYPVV